MTTSPRSTTARPARMKNLQWLRSWQSPIVAFRNREVKRQTDEEVQLDLQSDDPFLDSSQPFSSSSSSSSPPIEGTPRLPRGKKTPKRFFLFLKRVSAFQKPSSMQPSKTPVAIRRVSATEGSGPVHRDTQDEIPATPKSSATIEEDKQIPGDPSFSDPATRANADDCAFTWSSGPDPVSCPIFKLNNAYLRLFANAAELQYFEKEIPNEGFRSVARIVRLPLGTHSPVILGTAFGPTALKARQQAAYNGFNYLKQHFSDELHRLGFS